MTIIDESLFGIRDVGYIPLSELVSIYRGDYSITTNDEWLNGGFICLTEPEYELYFSKVANDKFELMRCMASNDDQKYLVKFEIIYKEDPSLPPHWPYKFEYAMNVWIDDILMNDCSTNCYYLWNPIYNNINYKTEISVIKNINEAHNKYLQTLYYAEFKANMTRITEELIATTMHPRRLIRHLELGGEIEDF